MLPLVFEIFVEGVQAHRVLDADELAQLVWDWQHVPSSVGMFRFHYSDLNTQQV